MTRSGRAHTSAWLVGWLTACLAAAAIAGPAWADGGRAKPRSSGTLRDAVHGYQIVVAPGWRPLPAPDGTLAAYQAGGGRAYLALTRIGIGVRRAHDAAALAGEIERGVARASRSFGRVKRRLTRVGRVAVLDLWYRRADDGRRRLVLSRYLLYPRHAVVLSIGLAAGARRAERRAAKAMTRSFVPFSP